MTLWFAARHPRTPWYARAVGAITVIYAFSPIDLIPDFIPVLGYLDDVVLLPLLVCLTVRLLPPDVLAASRAQAAHWIAGSFGTPRSLLGAGVVVAIWLLFVCALSLWAVKTLA